MPNRTPTNDKALAWWCKEHNLIPQLSAHPIYFFKHRETGESSKRNINNLTSEYKDYIEQEKKARKRKGNK